MPGLLWRLPVASCTEWWLVLCNHKHTLCCQITCYSGSIGLGPKSPIFIWCPFKVLWASCSTLKEKCCYNKASSLGTCLSSPGGDTWSRASWGGQADIEGWVHKIAQLRIFRTLPVSISIFNGTQEKMDNHCNYFNTDETHFQIVFPGNNLSSTFWTSWSFLDVNEAIFKS